MRDNAQVSLLAVNFQREKKEAMVMGNCFYLRLKYVRTGISFESGS